MSQRSEQEMDGIFRKLLLMALIERLEAEASRDEAEEKAFVTLTGTEARFVLCLN